MDKAINKKEYLKKYLSGNIDKKKKKKKITSIPALAKSKIIDDDIDLKNMKPVNDDDLEIYDLCEDAPQIAGIIDDRPAEIRVMAEYRETKKWKIVTKEYEDVKVSEMKDKDSDSDRSPPRNRVHSSNDHLKRDDSDSDVSVKRRNENSSSSKNKVLQSKRRSERHSDIDLSPARESKRLKHSKAANGYDSDNSPPRKKVRGSDSDASPPRKRKHHHHENKIRDLEKHCQEDSDDEQPRRHKHSNKRHKRDDLKVKKTLEGKKAGLQDATELRKEAAEIRLHQAESLAKLGDELSGRGAAAVFRDKKTGRKRDLKEEAKQRREREEKDAEQAAKYAVWGKGVKQVDDKETKMKEDLHEMSKPLARYANDSDLENMLRNEEKEGDPMLEYIRAKKIKEGKGGKARPQYQGSYLPNRYNIKPGYRWDGVDRSNGYEKKYFEEINSRKAREEEAFKWSTEDM